METDYLNAGMLVSCYKAIGDAEGARRAARRAVERVEKVIALELMSWSLIRSVTEIGLTQECCKSVVLIKGHA